MQGDKVVVVTPQGEEHFDFLILGTGFDMDIGRRPEIATLAPHMLRWRDRFTPPDHERNDTLLDLPYLGAACEFQPREPGTCPVLNRISILGAAATLSIGPMFGGLNGVKFLLERVVDQTCRALMMETLESFYVNFEKRFHETKPQGAMGSTD